MKEYTSRQLDIVQDYVKPLDITWIAINELNKQVVKIHNKEFLAGDILFELDELALAEYETDMISGMVEKGRWIRHEKSVYDVDDIEWHLNFMDERSDKEERMFYERLSKE